MISPSGMCGAGRVLHHLRHNVGDARNTSLITVYRAETTLGRKLKEGWKSGGIFGIPAEVRAQAESLGELSGHADNGELLEWIKARYSRARRKAGSGSAGADRRGELRD